MECNFSKDKTRNLGNVFCFNELKRDNFPFFHYMNHVNAIWVEKRRKEKIPNKLPLKINYVPDILEGS